MMLVVEACFTSGSVQRLAPFGEGSTGYLLLLFGLFVLF